MFCSIRLFMFDKIVSQSFHEFFVTNLLPKHANYCTTFILANGIKNFVNFLSSLYRYRYRVAGFQAVQVECAGADIVYKRVQMSELREERVGAECLDEGSERLVEPEVVPPLHGDQVAEPLVREFMAHHCRHPRLLLYTRLRPNQ